MKDTTGPRGWAKWWRILRGTGEAYFEDKIPQLGAALAFYATIAVVPMMVLFVGLAGLVFRNPDTREHMLRQVEHLAGISRDEALSLTPTAPRLTSAAAWFSFATFLIGGLGVFSHLQDALNVIWRAPKRRAESWGHLVRRRLFSYATIVGAAIIILVSMVLSAVLGWLGETAEKWAGSPAVFAEAANFGFSFVVLLLLFAVIFKMLPDVAVHWRDVWFGAAVAALLFDLGKTALGAYLAHSRVTSGWGAAASAIALLLWSYYAGQIVFLGAEFSRVRAWVRENRDLHFIPASGLASPPIGGAAAVPATAKRHPAARRGGRGSGPSTARPPPATR